MSRFLMDAGEMEVRALNAVDSGRQDLASRDAGRIDAAILAGDGDVDARRKLADDEYRRGVACRQQNRLSDAMKHYERAVALAGHHAPAYNNLGVIRQEWGEVSASATAYQQAIEADPRFGLAWFNLGNCFRQENQQEEAVACYRRALELMPADAETRINLAVVLRELRQFDASLAVLDEIPRTSCESPKARFNRSLVHLLRGELDRGWDEYEGRLEIEPSARSLPAPRWDGSPLAGRSILLLAEQGIGDQVMFASCVPDVLEGAGNVAIECDARLVPLFARSFPQMTAIAKTACSDEWPPTGPWDVAEHIGTLPRYVRRRIAAFPQTGGFMRPDARRVAKWRSQFARMGGAMKVGISWHGGRDLETRRRRSIPLELWGPMFTVPGVRFINLQYGAAAGDARRSWRLFGVPLDDGGDCDPLLDLDDFTAKIAALDLVVSVDNSTAHLAAAIGQAVWTLLPFAPDWRWMLEGETTPWYPTMRLLRCPRRNEWSQLLRHAARRLASATFSRELQSRAA